MEADLSAASIEWWFSSRLQHTQRPIHKAARVQFSQHYRNKGFSYWSQVMFTDPKYVTISSSSGRSGCYQLTVGATRNCAHPKARCRLAARLHGCIAFGLTDMVMKSNGSPKTADFAKRWEFVFWSLRC